ncbi:MAG TPA: hypothetical protein VMH28_19970 [Candidatus Acidoferrales bacterium]|nr:hypothetical protein [Candidatus Acidoferrales bacterium]
MMPSEESQENGTMPESEPRPVAAAEAPRAMYPSDYPWYHKMWAFIFITFCLEIGLFLLIFPWTDYWGSNYFSNLLPQMETWWDNMYLRGAISGIGAANLYISCVEIFRLKRFARR